MNIKFKPAKEHFKNYLNPSDFLIWAYKEINLNHLNGDTEKLNQLLQQEVNKYTKLLEEKNSRENKFYLYLNTKALENKYTDWLDDEHKQYFPRINYTMIKQTDKHYSDMSLEELRDILVETFNVHKQHILIELKDSYKHGYATDDNELEPMAEKLFNGTYGKMEPMALCRDIVNERQVYPAEHPYIYECVLIYQNLVIKQNEMY